MSYLLFTSTIVCFSGYLSQILVKYLMIVMYPVKKLDQPIRAEIRKLEREMSEISVIDEFAKYTRLQRKHTKLMDELKSNISGRASLREKTQFSLVYRIKIVFTLFSMYLMYMYGKEPVLILPKGLLWPFENLLSWPSPHEDAISLVMWMILARLVAHDIFK